MSDISYMKKVTQMAHTVLIIALVGCASPVSKDYPWNLSPDDWRGVLASKVDRARMGDEAALRDMLWFQEVTDTERTELLSFSLGRAFNAVDRTWFLKVVNREPYYIRALTYETFEYEGIPMSRAELGLKGT